MEGGKKTKACRHNSLTSSHQQQVCHNRSPFTVDYGFHVHACALCVREEKGREGADERVDLRARLPEPNLNTW